MCSVNSSRERNQLLLGVFLCGARVNYIKRTSHYWRFSSKAGRIFTSRDTIFWGFHPPYAVRMHPSEKKAILDYWQFVILDFVPLF